MEFLQVKATEKSRSTVQYLFCLFSQSSHEMKMHFLQQLYFGMHMELIKAETNHHKVHKIICKNEI